MAQGAKIIPPPPPPPPPAKVYGEEVFMVVEEMPLFPGTSNMKDSNKELLAFVYKNLKYPKQAKDLAIEGVAVAKFVISKRWHC